MRNGLRGSAPLLLWFAVLAVVAVSGCGGEGTADTSGPPMETSTSERNPGMEEANSRVVMKTSEGDITIELDGAKAPATVENFLNYARDGFYDGTTFHRVIPGFMIQGGGFTPDMQQKPTEAAVKNEAANGLKNQRGTIAMARTQAVDSATSQFFINVVDNGFLDHRDSSPGGFGYAVFGRVVDGMATVDAIAGVSTTTRGPFTDVPVEPVTIEQVTVQE